MLNLQADGLESVEVQRRIFKDGNDSLLFAVAVANSPEECREMRKRFEALPTVGKVEELATRLPQAPPETTRRLVQAMQAELSHLPKSVPQVGAPNPASVGKAMERIYQASLRLGDDALSVSRKLDQFLNRFERLPFNQQAVLLNRYQQQMTSALQTQFQLLATSSDPEPLTIADLPPELTSRFISNKGKWLLQIYPKDQVWEFEPLSRFVKELRTVDPEVTGTPLQNFEASRQIKASYEQAAIYAFVVICVVLLMDFLGGENKLLALVPPLVVIAFTSMTLLTRGIAVQPMYLVLGYLAMVIAIAAILDFRNLCDMLLALMPPVAGGAMLFGSLVLLHIDLNAANLIVLPLVLGIGVDNGVYIVHDYRARVGKGQYTLEASTVQCHHLDQSHHDDRFWLNDDGRSSRTVQPGSGSDPRCELLPVRVVDRLAVDTFVRHARAPGEEREEEQQERSFRR